MSYKLKNKIKKWIFYLNRLDIKLLSMYNKTDIKKEEFTIFTVRMDRQMQDMVTYLQEKKLLNKTSIIRWSIADAYQREKAKEIKNGDFNDR